MESPCLLEERETFHHIEASPTSKASYPVIRKYRHAKNVDLSTATIFASTKLAKKCVKTYEIVVKTPRVGIKMPTIRQEHLKLA